MANVATPTRENGAKPKHEQLILKFRDLSWITMRRIANRFTIKNVDLDDIEAEKERHARISRVVDLLIERNLVASWKKVVDVLNDVEQEALAKEVEREYCKTTQRPETEVSTQPTHTGSTVVPFHGENCYIIKYLLSHYPVSVQASSQTNASLIKVTSECKFIFVHYSVSFF